MKDNQPLVSVVIPTYNSEKYIERCLKCLKNQTYDNMEIIVVDNNSSDSTKEIARKYADNVFNQEGGMGVQVNRGVKESNGEYVAFFDDDMYLSSEVIEECVTKIMNGVDAVIVPEKTMHNSFWSKVRDIEKSFYEGDINIEAARFYPKKIFLEVGGINEKLKGFRDFDIHQKVKRAGHRIGRIESILEHDVDPDFLSVLKKRFERAGTLSEYLKENPSHTKSIIFRKSLITGIVKLSFRKPLLALGLIILKFGEYTASGIGLILYKIKQGRIS